jgi:hypothetical protein
LKVNVENRRIRIHQSEAWIRGYGSTPNVMIPQHWLRIRDVFFYPGFVFSIPEPGFTKSQIRIRIKELFNPKKQFLSSRKNDLGCSSQIQVFDEKKYM